MSIAIRSPSTRTPFTALPVTRSFPVFGSITPLRDVVTSVSDNGIESSAIHAQIRHPISRRFYPNGGAPRRCWTSLCYYLLFHPGSRKVSFGNTGLFRPDAVRYDGAAVRQRPIPHRPHHGVHPGRRLGALSADARTHRPFRLRRRHARRTNHAEGGGRRRYATSAGRAHHCDASKTSRRVPLKLRSLAFDRFARKRRV